MPLTNSNLPMWRHYGFRDGYHRLRPERDASFVKATPEQILVYREGHKAGVEQRLEEDRLAAEDE